MYSYNETLEVKPPLSNNFVVSNQYASWKKQPEIVKLRRRVLILVGLLLGLACINFIVGLILFAIKDLKNDDSTEGISQLFNVLWAAIYLGFGFYAAYRYFRIALLIFGWSGLVSLLISLVTITIGLIHTMKVHKEKVEAKIIGSIIIIVVTAIATTLQIFILRYVFALAKLLKITKSTANQRV